MTPKEKMYFHDTRLNSLLTKKRRACINEHDLRMKTGNKYDLHDLDIIMHYCNVNYRTVLTTQTLNDYLCCRYIFDPEEDYLIDVALVLTYQPHLSKESLTKCYDEMYSD